MKTHFEKANPPGTKYPRLRTRGAAYWCDKWQVARDGVYCMYYASQGAERVNKKRIPLVDMQAAEAHLRAHQKFDRRDFSAQCPTAARHGGCAFNVMGRILENCCDAGYDGANGFVLRK